MDGFTLGNNIITGIIAGVSAGLILSAFSYVKQHFDHKMERRNQIEYIRQIVEDFQEKVSSIQRKLSEPGTPPITNMRDTIDNWRWIQFEITYDAVVKTLEGRASCLTYDEKKELLDAFYLYHVFRPGGAFGDQGVTPGEGQYHDIFDKLEAIEWLKVRGADRNPFGTKAIRKGSRSCNSPLVTFVDRPHPTCRYKELRRRPR